MGSIISLAGRAMRRAVGCVGWLMALSAGMAAGQKPAPQQNVTVVVVDSHVDPSKPVAAVGVSLSYVDSGTRVTDARDVTNPKGEAYLQVSSDAPQRGDLRVEVRGATNLVIYQPADGQLQGLGPKVTVRLLPKGSAGLLGPAQIEAVLHRTLLQVNSLQKQNQALKNQKPDLSLSLTEVARAYGFAPAEFDKKVQQWAQEVQADPAADARKKGLAEVALKHYAEASQLFTQATNADAAAMDADEEKFLEGRRTKLRQLLNDAQQSANAAQLNLQYHQATATLQAARDRAAAERKRYADDTALHEIWMDAAFAVARARVSEGEVSPASQSLPLLVQATEDYQALAREYLASGDKTNWALTRNNLGIALADEGQRSSGDKSAALFDQAVQAFRSALEVYAKADLPQDWAATQNNLGAALADEGERSSGGKSAALFDQAVQAYRNALEVRTKADLPQGWAITQNNLGKALDDEGQRSSGDKSAALFDQAVQAFRSALEVYTKADLPQGWARTQSNLGAALADEGERSSGDKSAALFDQAVQAYRSALEVYTKADLPQDWAMTQNNLGAALDDEGERSSGDKSAALLDQAVQAYRSALEVYTKADLPQDWAMTQNNLGIALKHEGERSSGDKSAALLDQAVQAYRSALEVYTKADLPQDWAMTQNNLGAALADEGERGTGDKSAALFDQAVQAYRSALEVRTKAADPYHWAQTMRNLSLVYKDQGNAAAAQQALDEANAVDPL